MQTPIAPPLQQVQESEALSSSWAQRSWPSWLIPPYTGPSTTQQAVYAVLAACGLVLDIAAYATGDLAITTPHLAGTAVFCTLLVLAGVKGTPVEAIYIAAFLLGIAPAISVELYSSGLGIYTICISWIARRWIVPAVILLLSTEVAQYPIDVSLLGWDFGYFIFNTTITFILNLGLGLALLFFNTRAARLHATAESYRVAADEAEHRVRHEIAEHLHDSTARDLSEVALLAQGLADSGTAGPADLNRLALIASRASTQIRPLIGSSNPPLTPSQGATHGTQSSLATAIEDARDMLSGRSIALDVDIPKRLNANLTDMQQRTGALIVSEGATNILKYAPQNSDAGIDIEVAANGDLSLTLTSEYGEHDAELPTGMTSGFGLANLSERIEGEGGKLHFARAGTQWILHAFLLSRKEPLP